MTVIQYWPSRTEWVHLVHLVLCFVWEKHPEIRIHTGFWAGQIAWLVSQGHETSSNGRLKTWRWTYRIEHKGICSREMLNNQTGRGYQPVSLPGHRLPEHGVAILVGREALHFPKEWAALTKADLLAASYRQCWISSMSASGNDPAPSVSRDTLASCLVAGWAHEASSTL